MPKLVHTELIMEMLYFVVVAANVENQAVVGTCQADN
jgi:hypothetical protein